MVDASFLLQIQPPQKHMKAHSKDHRNYIHAPVNQYPAPAYAPMARFTGTLFERMQRSPVACAVMQKITETRHRH